MTAMHYKFLAVLCAPTLIPRDAYFAMTPKFTGNPGYDDATVQYLRAYFRRFLQAGEKP